MVPQDGTISQSGKPAEPVLTAGEKAADVITRAAQAAVELAGDLPRFGRLSRAADAIGKEVFDASLDAMVTSGRFDKDAIDKIKAENPFYVSARRVLDLEGK